MFELIMQAIYSGILQGGSYALIALGLALIFGSMKIINLAHGELVLLAAYIAYSVETSLSINALFAIPIAMLVVCCCAFLVYFSLSFVRQDRELNSLLLTYGLSVILTNSLLLMYAADIQSTQSAWLQEGIVFGELYSMRSELLFFVVGLFLLFLLWWWLSRSWYGRALRAVSSHRDAAKLMGINPMRVEIISFLLAGILASFAGVAIFSYGVIQPSLGHALTIKAFIITVLAGMGSIPGVIIGALLLGIAEALTITLASSALQELVGMGLFLLVLFVLPNGLFGRTLRRG